MLFQGGGLRFEDLPVVLAFAKSPNASLAAASLGMSQPAFNERLRKIDAEFRPSLFAWNGNKRVLSEFGKKFVVGIEPRVRELFGSMENIVESEQKGGGRPLRVAGRTEVFARLEAGVAEYRHPLLFRSCSSHESVSWVENGDVDVAITVVRPQSPKLLIRKIFTSHAVLAVHKKILKKAKISPESLTEKTGWRALQNVPWLAYASNDKLFLDFWSMAQVDISALNVRLYCDNWPTLWRFVKAGVGCAVLPAAYVEASADVVAVPPVEGFQKNPFYLVYGKEKSDWPRVREFVAMCASKLGEG